MTRQLFHEELEALQQELIRMGTLVEHTIFQAVQALAQRDPRKAQQVIEGDDIVDKLMLEIEGRCFRLLALQQPMAGDLRIIGTAMKITTDLERMADYAVDIAKTVVRLGGEPLIKPLVDIPRMAELAMKMTRDALTAYVNRDVELARSMINQDHEVDHLYGQVFRELLVYMMEDPKTIKQATSLLFVAAALERIGDHATNLGEWIIYMVTGRREDLND